MDETFTNDIEREEENIRLPDEIKVERLIDYEIDDDIENAISISLQELVEQQKNYQQYEEELINNHFIEMKKRKEIFTALLFNLNKCKKFDIEINEVYLIINPIIDSYCNQYIHACYVDEKIYDKIFTTLKKIRINTVALDTLKTIIIKDYYADEC